MKSEKMSHILETIAAFVGDSPNDLAVTKAVSRLFAPYAVLVSTIIANRCRDEVTQVASRALLNVADHPAKMLQLSDDEIAKIIYPASFYRTKARAIRKASKQIWENGNVVPNTLEGLMELYGVGRKTANLVLTLGFKKPAICVDTHVHRISNRLGFVKTSKPEETERALLKVLPEKWWIDINGTLIAFGRAHCTPISPKCSICPVQKQCKQVGITHKR